MIKQVNQAVKNTIEDKFGLMPIVKGILVSYIITIPIFIIFALILTYTNFPEKLIPSAVMVTTIISILTAGSVATRNIRNKGWLNGAIVGLVYVGILYLLSSIIFMKFTIDSNVLFIFLLAMVTGSIGGIIGINLKKNAHGRQRGKTV
jgi:putative membrane protein (TIGR04086 family)